MLVKSCNVYCMVNDKTNRKGKDFDFKSRR